MLIDCDKRLESTQTSTLIDANVESPEAGNCLEMKTWRQNRKNLPIGRKKISYANFRVRMQNENE